MSINTRERNFVGCNVSFEEAAIVLLGAPFDGTVSFRTGTRMAPSQIRNDSIGLETYSPYLDKDLINSNTHDAGDIDLPYGNTKKTMLIIEDTVDRIMQADKKVFMVGGEHLVTYPAAKAVLKKYPDLCFIHFDAHTDLRDTFFGEELSHATVIKRIWDMVGDNRIWQFGIRSGSREEFLWAEAGHTHLEKFNVTTIDKAISDIGDRPVYITVDLDVLDTSVFPGTGTPEAGGIGFMELLNALIKTANLNIVAADVVELAPNYDNSGVSTAVACKTIREMLLLLGQ